MTVLDFTVIASDLTTALSPNLRQQWPVDSHPKRKVTCFPSSNCLFLIDWSANSQKQVAVFLEKRNATLFGTVQNKRRSVSILDFLIYPIICMQGIKQYREYCNKVCIPGKGKLIAFYTKELFLVLLTGRICIKYNDKELYLT